MNAQTDQECNHLEATVDLQASESFYRRLFECARDSILVLDVGNQKITDANRAAQELLGYSRDELLDKELWEVGLFKNKKQGQTASRELLARATFITRT
jgi:PAS domain S-box-containing protein